MDGMTRRGFISRSAKSMLTVVGGAAVAALPGKARAVSANDRVVMAVIGVGGRGRDVSRQFVNSKGAVMAYVCDADEKRIGSYPDQLERLQKRAPKAVQDMRRVFDDKEVDAVLVSTCDHWHGLATVWACQAGKDVYVEKPPCHNLWEGQKMVEAARKYGRVVQCGLQNRSAAYALAAREYIQSGKLGDIPLVKVYNMKGGGPFTCPQDSPKPDGLDYDLYLGPALAVPCPTRTFGGNWLLPDRISYLSATRDDGLHTPFGGGIREGNVQPSVRVLRRPFYGFTVFRELVWCCEGPALAGYKAFRISYTSGLSAALADRFPKASTSSASKAPRSSSSRVFLSASRSTCERTISMPGATFGATHFSGWCKSIFDSDLQGAPS